MWRKKSQLSLSLSHINLPKFLLSTIGKESNKTNIDKKCYYFTQEIKKKKYYYLQSHHYQRNF